MAIDRWGYKAALDIDIYTRMYTYIYIYIYTH